MEINNDSKSSYLKGLSKDKLGIIKNLDEEMLEQLEQQNLNNEKKDEIIKEDNKKIQESLIKEDNKTGARLGEIEWNGKTFETPMFMPVGTQATVKALSPEQVKDCGAGIILANTYHLWLRPGED